MIVGNLYQARPHQSLLVGCILQRKVKTDLLDLSGYILHWEINFHEIDFRRFFANPRKFMSINFFSIHQN